MELEGNSVGYAMEMLAKADAVCFDVDSTVIDEEGIVSSHCAVFVKVLTVCGNSVHWFALGTDGTNFAHLFHDFLRLGHIVLNQSANLTIKMCRMSSQKLSAKDQKSQHGPSKR